MTMLLTLPAWTHTFLSASCCGHERLCVLCVCVHVYLDVCVRVCVPCNAPQPGFTL